MEATTTTPQTPMQEIESIKKYLKTNPYSLFKSQLQTRLADLEKIVLQAIKPGDKISTLIYNTVVTGTVSGREVDNGILFIDFIDSNNENRWCYLRQIRNINGLPVNQ